MSRHHIHRTEGPRGTRWHATVELGNDPLTGKRRQKRLSAATRKALDLKIADTLTRLNDGRAVTDSAVPLRAYLAEWLRTVEPAVKGSTHRSLVNRCEVWIIPALGDVRLRDLTARQIDRLLRQMLAAGRAASYARAVYGVLRMALNAAVKWELIGHNPCTGVTPPRAADTEIQTWNADEASRAIAVSAHDARYGALWRLALTTGMRRGELLGLRWQDVDLDRRAIAVRQIYVRGIGHAIEFSTPKSTRSRRSIAISPEDVASLRRHRTAQLAARLAAGGWSGHDLVFCDAAGEPIRAMTLHRALNRLATTAELPRLRFHDLRHTAATLMLAAGEHPKIVSERLGHSTVSMTLDRYSHVTPTMQEAAADRLEALLKRAAES